MKIFKGSLTYQDYFNLHRNKYFLGKNFSINQIQPSSVDLTLSDECYQISASFLSTSNTVRKNLKKTKLKSLTN